MKLRKPESRLREPVKTEHVVGVESALGRDVIPPLEIEEEGWHLMRGDACASTIYSGGTIGKMPGFSYPFLWDRLKKSSVFNDREIEMLRTQLQEFPPFQYREYSEVAIAILTQRPDLRSELKLDPKVFESLKAHMDLVRDKYNFLGIDLAFRAALLFPDRKAELELDDEMFKKAEETVRRAYGQDDAEALRIAMKLFILNPRRKQYLGLTPEIFTAVRQNLPAMIRWDHDWAVETATCYTVLAADDVRITEQGVQLIYNDELVQQRKLPDRKLVA